MVLVTLLKNNPQREREREVERERERERQTGTHTPHTDTDTDTDTHTHTHTHAHTHTHTHTGSSDLDCDKWDHVHTVAMACDATDSAPLVREANVSPLEIGRWITPYRRRVGHWLTPASRLLASIRNATSCNVTLSTCGKVG